MYSYDFSVTLICPIKITMYSDFVLLPLNVIMYDLQCFTMFRSHINASINVYNLFHF